ncbi:MAG: hypothetical protein AB7O26_12505 [Planctomycetaceae bacterium]
MIVIRHRHAALLFAVAAIAMLGAAPTPVRPSVDPGFQPAPIVQAPTFVTPEVRTPATTPEDVPSSPLLPPGPSNRFRCPYDFWIASSRRCQQSHAKACFAGQLEYYHADSNNIFSKRDQPSFQQWLQPGVPVCIVVHGSYVQSTDLLDEDPHMYQWIRGAAPDRPLHIVFYSWPSDGPITGLPPADVGILGRRASFNALYLADLIASIPPHHSVCVVGHSHGARTVASALHLLAGGEVQGHYMSRIPQQCARLRAVLIAGALDHHWIVPGQRYGRALYRVESLLNVKNNHDIALNAYPFRRPFSHRALGEAGVQKRDRMGLGPLSPRILDLDVTAWIASGHLWYNYYQRPEIALALRPYFFFEETPRSPYPAYSWRANKLHVEQTGGNVPAVRPLTPSTSRQPVKPLHGSSDADPPPAAKRS